MCYPIQVLEKRINNIGVLHAVIYTTSNDSPIFALDIEKEMLQEFEYANEEREYAYNCDFGYMRPYTTYQTPNDLSENELQTLINAHHHEDCELHTRQEWEAKK